MKFGLALCVAAFFATLAPAFAQDSLQGLAPANEYFGKYHLSVLGVANTIRDARARVDAGGDTRWMLTGPLTFVTDAMHDWEAQYPADPWIAKDLLALEAAYLRVPTDDGFRLASQTELWLSSDYPNSVAAAQGRKQLADAAAPVSLQPRQYYAAVAAPAPPAIPSYATPWGRYAALRR